MKPASNSLDEAREVLRAAATSYVDGNSLDDLCDAAIEYAAFVQAHLAIEAHYRSVER